MINNINESEKNRIRKLHRNYSVIKEQDIDVEDEPVGVDPIGPVDDGEILKAPIEKTKTVTQSAPSGIPCQQIYTMLMGSSVPQFQAYATGGVTVDAICHKCNSHHQSQGLDWASYGPQGQQICLLLIQNPQCCTNQPPTMWKCSPTGTCTQDPNGQFQTQQDCINSGCGDVYCTDCQGGTMTMGTAGVCPQGYVPNPGTPGSTQPTPVCYECDGNGNCNGPGWTMGQMSFNSQADCQAACQPTDWECISPGNCQQTPTGTFPTQAACMASPGCQPPPNMWECDMNNGCSQTPTGTYNSQTQCETACCQDVINNWNWAQGSQSNPCQKFHNLFHSNPPTTFADQCKYDYLYNLILNLPGANPCVQGNFIDLLDGYMGLNGQGSGNIGCYGNPNSGGVQGNPALYNSVCGKIIQFGNANPMTPSKYFKWQYAIWFANQNGCIC